MANVAVIAGAGSGLSASLARLLSKEGLRVVLAAPPRTHGGLLLGRFRRRRGIEGLLQFRPVIGDLVHGIAEPDHLQEVVGGRAQ